METDSKILEKVDKLLNDYEHKVGLPSQAKYHDQATDYFNMKRDQLEALSIEDCAHAAYILTNMALHIQRTLNKETARGNWVKRQMAYFAADKQNNYHGSWAQKEVQAIKDDSFGRKLQELTLEIGLRVDSLNYIATNVRQLSEALANLQKAKVGAKNG
jgi:hypothetical protein